MSRRKQSHPRAWKETVENKQRESDNAADSSQQGMLSSDCIHGNTHQEDLTEDSLSCKFIEAIQHATVGQTLGPISPSVCEITDRTISESEEKSEKVEGEGAVTSLRMRLQGMNGGEEDGIDFVPVANEEDAHLIISKTGRGIFVKLAKRFETASEIRGLLVIEGQTRCDIEDGEVEVRAVKEETIERLAEHPSLTSSASHGDEEQMPSVTKKCPNCSVCFRNTGNLAAHQMYYCTGVDRKDFEVESPRGDIGSKSRSISKSPSPRLLSRVSGGNSAEGETPHSPLVHICQLCQSSFMSRQNCESHMLILHCGEHVPICKFCNFVAQSWDVLREHVFTHVRVERRKDEEGRRGEGTVECNECARSSKDCKHSSVDDDEAPEVKGSAGGSKRHKVGAVPTPEGDISGTVGRRGKTDSKRKGSSVWETNKRTRWGDVMDRRTPGENCSPSPTVAENGGEPTSAVVSATMCRACNICFRSKENYIAHKKYYCKQRHSDPHDSKAVAAGTSSSTSSSREGSPEYSEPSGSSSNEVHRRNPRGSPLHYGDEERSTLPQRLDRPMKGPPHAPLMYMSSMVPSAMFIGGTQLISPNGAHLISPVFLLTPPVAIPVTGVEPSLPTPASDHLWKKKKDRGESPLDLSVRSPSSTPDNFQHLHGVGEDRSDNPSPHSPSSVSPKKSFTCGQCGISFWKANTLIAHKQLYCSETKKKGSPSSSRGAQERHPSNPVQSDSSDQPLHDPSSQVSVERHRLPSASPNHSRHNQHLEKYFTSFHLENQIYKGLHLCSGCGVAFRKLESLEIHQKFYCQKSSSSAAAGHRHLPREGVSGDRRKKSSQSEKGIGSPKESNFVQMGKSRSGGRLESVEEEGHPRLARGDQSNTRGTSLRDANPGKGRNGRQSLEIGANSSHSPNHDVHRRARSWPTMVDQDMVDDNTSVSVHPLLPGGFFEIKVKSEENATDFGDRVSEIYSPEDVRSSNGCIRIKAEVTSPGSDDRPTCASTNREKDKFGTRQFNGKVSQPVAVVGRVRPPDSTFLPGSKACRSCNISFHSLSTFIAHKKYYCSSTAGQRSKLST